MEPSLAIVCPDGTGTRSSASRGELSNHLSEAVVVADVAGEDHVGQAGEAAFVAQAPDGNARGDLPHDCGAPHAQGANGDVAGGDTTLGDGKRGCWCRRPTSSTSAEETL